MAYNLDLDNKLNNIVGEALASFTTNKLNKELEKVKELKFKEQYQGRIIDCMVGEVDDNYIITPETDAPIVKLENSREGLVKVPSIKGKTILVDVDGNETDTPAEGCRLVSAGEEEDNKLIILSKNKNLCPNVYENKYVMENGEYSATSKNNILSEFIRVKSNTKYSGLTIQANDTKTNDLFWSLYDINKKFIRRVFASSITTTQEEFYIRVHRSGIDSATPPIHLQVNEGEPTLVYIQPNQHKTEILLDEPLRKINNNNFDYIKNNSVVINTVGITFDGTEGWQERKGNHYENTYCFEFVMSKKAYKQYGAECISNIFPNYGTWNDYEHIWVNEFNRATIHISTDKLPSSNVEDFKLWLTKNNVDLIYKIEPIIEELPNSITLQGFDDTTMYIENSITPTVTYGYNALIPFKEEIKTQKEEVEFNTSGIEENIIPYLMDVEFNLMMMEDK